MGTLLFFSERCLLYLGKHLKNPLMGLKSDSATRLGLKQVNQRWTYSALHLGDEDRKGEKVYEAEGPQGLLRSE